ncbi:hypothetical protein FH969_11820 [Miniimonas arenae]|uniref:LPXTG cell wall anchor domain-containing protein n=2 Tax=Miniimonas TaxID=947525 RepID=A0A5C5BBU8_9MICO|nr:hypothetical protein [Miniimonas arenae]TNU73356.1 hypothetical protein FH969_11820 [Miniimonas arenae]
MTRPARRAAAFAAAFAVVGALSLGLALPASAVASVSPAPCAGTPLRSSFASHYVDGRYELASVTLDGLQACAQADARVTITSASGDEWVVETVVPADALVLDVRTLEVPTAQVDGLGVTLTAFTTTDPPVTAPPVGADAGSAAADAGSAATAGVAAARTGLLATTGAPTLSFAAAALGLLLLGVLLRRRADREDRNNV